MNPPRRIGILSTGILRIPHLATLLQAEPVFISGLARPRVDAIAGWGLRPSARRARALAQRHNLPYIALEDGFLRSLQLGGDDPPLSIVLDDEGIYYAADAPSRLERLVAEPLPPPLAAAAAGLVADWREARVSKYNHLREWEGALPESYVLVVDQTAGDASVRHGSADAASFRRMLEAARAEHPHSTVLVKTHPDVFAGKRRGYLGELRPGRDPRLQLLAENVHPVRLLEQARAVYTVTSQLGFEALLWGRPLRTFGMPFYAGYGLSTDDLAPPPRRRPATLAQLAHAALVAYPRYVDPETGAACGVATVLAHLALQRRQRTRFPPQLHALGFSAWKRPLVCRFLQGSTVTFVRSAAEVPAGGTLVCWGVGERAQRLPPAAAVLRIEDGFLRSVGLGADLVRPSSWIVDARGMYYDATAPSDLEHLLQTAAFDAPLLARAARLREAIVGARISKYNAAGARWQRPAGAARVILVAGQVETDASLRWGGGAGLGNLELLRRTRRDNPQAYILYKPHPDVVAGLRAGAVEPAEAARLCDAVVAAADIGELLEAVDEVHVLTSLAGFEALLRGRRVVCHGMPFYAGWGLTVDHTACARRTRRLALDELVAAALILYPRYVSRATGRLTSPERTLDELLAARARGGGRAPWWRLPLRVLLAWRGRR